MKTVCQENQCAGCSACVDVCPRNAINIVDDLIAYNAVIGGGCINCGACYKVCQKNNPPMSRKPLKWFQGWAAESEIRKAGSSGGVAGALSRIFLKNGGEVCSCIFESGEFLFQFAQTVKDLTAFTGSKYIKSNPKGIYITVREKLKAGISVLFIGLPCQVAALRNFVGKKLEENLTTIDLICHGTPSPKVLEVYLQQYGVSLQGCKNISFRTKGKFRIEKDSTTFVPRGSSDRYMISFLNSLSYTENCYYCQYAKLERVSDITLGDSWGSELSCDERERGISLILCQTEKGMNLVETSELELKPVDLDKAIEHNHQLNYPSMKPKKRMAFFADLQNNKKFNRCVFDSLPMACIRQNIKGILIKAHIIVR